MRGKSIELPLRRNAEEESMHKTSGQRRTSEGQGIFTCAVIAMSRLAQILSERGFFNEELAIPVVRNYMSKQTELTCGQSTFTRRK